MCVTAFDRILFETCQAYILKGVEIVSNQLLFFNESCFEDFAIDEPTCVNLRKAEKEENKTG